MLTASLQERDSHEAGTNGYGALPDSRVRQFYAVRTRKSLLLLTLIASLFIALRLWHLTTYGLWFDEVFSYRALHLSWSKLIGYVVADAVHPPLFYLLLKLWIGVGGESLLWLKLFPVLISVATLCPLWLLCRELKLTVAETNTAVFLIAVNASLILYAQELRMYGLLVFFSLWSMWLFVRLINRNDDRKQIIVGLFIVNLLLIYTQYFGWLLIAAEGLYLLFRKRQYLLRFSIITAGLVLCFAPWAYTIVFFGHNVVGSRQVHAIFGGVQGLFHADTQKVALLPLTHPRLADLAWHFATLNGPFYLRRTTSLGLIPFGFPLFLLAWQVLKGKQKSWRAPFWMLVSFSVTPVVFALIVSSVFSEVWSGRYMIIGTIPYLVLLAVAIHRLGHPWTRALLLLLITGWAGLSCVHRLSHGNDRFDWFGLVRSMRQAETATTDGRIKVYVFENFVGTPIEFSLQSFHDERFEVSQIRDTTELRGGHFWVAFRDTTWPTDRLPQTFVRDLGCQVGHEFSASTRLGPNPAAGEAVTLFDVSCQKPN